MNFIAKFTATQTGLILDLDKNQINLQKDAQDPNKDALLLTTASKRCKIPVVVGNKKTYLTMQEYACIKQLPLGKTAKEIGRDLKLSYRTVEGYFARVMCRTGCKNKRDLIVLLGAICS